MERVDLQNDQAIQLISLTWVSVMQLLEFDNNHCSHNKSYTNKMRQEFTFQHYFDEMFTCVGITTHGVRLVLVEVNYLIMPRT